MDSAMSSSLMAPSFLDEATLDLHLDDENIVSEGTAYIAAPTEQVREKVLKDVVAYVEVRSNNDNRSKAICKELEYLGADVQSHFTADVTHVVYKEGTKKTRDRAAKRGVHLVSVLWVDSCKQNQEHVTEHQFPIINPDLAGTPLFLAKRKKAKSMQPKDFADEVVSSVERVNKRLKRQALAARFKQLHEPVSHDHTPVDILCPFTRILVEDTQPRSPFASPSPSMRVNLTIPDTPASMQQKLDSLQKAMKSKDKEASSSPVRGHLEEPLQRKLFVCALENNVTDTSVDAALTSPGDDTMSKDTKKKRRLLPQKENCNMLADLVIPTKLSDSSHLPSLLDSVKRNPPVRRSGRKSIAGPGYLTCTINPTGSDKTEIGKKRTLKRKTSADAILLNDHRTPRRNVNMCSSNDSNLNADKANTFVNTSSCTSIVEKVKILESSSRQSRQIQNTGNSKVAESVTSEKFDAMQGKNIPDENVSGKDMHSNKVVNSANSDRSTVLRENGLVHDPYEFTDQSAKESARPLKKGRRQSFHNPLVPLDSFLPEKKALGTKTTRKMEKSLNTSQPPASTLNNNTTCSNHISSKNLSVKRITRRASFDLRHCADSINAADTSQDVCPSDQCRINDNISMSQTSILGESMSVLYGDSTLSSSLLSRSDSKSRTSIGEFSITKYKTKQKTKKRIPTITEVINELENSVDDTGEITSANSTVDNSVISSSQEVVQTKMLQKRKLSNRRPSAKKSQQHSKHTSSSSSSSQCSDMSPYNKNDKLNQSCFMPTSKRKRCLVMTNLHTGEQEIVISVVKTLGGFYMTDAVCENTTHVVCGEARRTLNVLLGIAQGCWLLSLEWALKSLEHGYWLDEDTYERQEFPAAQLSRADHRQFSSTRKCRLFAEAGAIFVCQKTNPPRENLVSLVQLCGGKVTTCRRKAEVIVGTEFHPDVTSVTPNWILDSVMAYQSLPFDAFMCSRPKRESSPEY